MKSIVLGAVLLCLSFPVCAQDFYTGKSTVTADGITFRVTEAYGTILTLSNITNTRGNALEVYKDGSPVEPEFEEYAVANTVPGCVEKAFTETFTKEEYESLRTDSEAILTMGYVISPEGNVEEVWFGFSKRPGLVALPPSKFALLEKNIKRYVKWEVNLFGRKLQFMHGMSFANFSKAKLQYASPEPEIPDLTLHLVPRDPGDEELKKPEE